MTLFDLLHSIFFPIYKRLRGKRTSGKILFTLLSRFGDNAISLRVITSIFRTNSEKLLIVTSKQFKPYVEVVLPKAEILSFNKRRDLFRIVHALKRIYASNPTHGYNPWCYGNDSRQLIDYAEKSIDYSELQFPTEYNWYARIYSYLQLPQPKVCQPPNNFPLLDNAATIHFAPFSTDPKRSLQSEAIKQIIEQLLTKKSLQKIVISGTKKQLQKIELLQQNKRLSLLKLNKTAQSSQAFLNSISSSDILITVDSGPLHIADLLSIPSIALFGPSNPDSVLHHETLATPIRTGIMAGTICMAKCSNPICMIESSKIFLAGKPSDNIRSTHITKISTHPCLFLNQQSER